MSELSLVLQNLLAQKVKINAKMINQLDWEITTDSKDCDYLLSAVRTIGTTNDRRLLGIKGENYARIKLRQAVTGWQTQYSNYISKSWAIQ